MAAELSTERPCEVDSAAAIAPRDLVYGFFKGARLLVVDDNKVNRLLLARNVESQGHRVELAENGHGDLIACGASPSTSYCSTSRWPEMDEFQVLEQIVADPQLCDVPVIVTSTVEGLESVRSLHRARR